MKDMNKNSGMENIHNEGAKLPAINLIKKVPTCGPELIRIQRNRPSRVKRIITRFIVKPLCAVREFIHRLYNRSVNIFLDLYASGLLYVVLTLLIAAFTLCLTSYVLYSLRELRIEIRENKTFAETGDTNVVKTYQESASSALSSHQIQGFIMPIEGARIPDRSSLLPNARREYRNGTHEGIDFFVPFGTPVIAAKAGRVIHVDGEGYQEPDKGFRDMLLKTSSRLSDTPRDIENILLGRYVILDHGLINGQRVITVYAHLDSVDEDITIGSYVKQGALIGKVGNSGTSTAGTSEGAHLHFELRVNNSYLGKGLPPGEVKRMFTWILEGQGGNQVAFLDKESVQ